MENNKIETGDTVCVNFNNTGWTLSSEALVMYTPCATGDSWVIRDIKSNELHYISEPCTVTLVKKGV